MTYVKNDTKLVDNHIYMSLPSSTYRLPCPCYLHDKYESKTKVEFNEYKTKLDEFAGILSQFMEIRMKPKNQNFIILRQFRKRKKFLNF